MRTLLAALLAALVGCAGEVASSTENAVSPVIKDAPEVSTVDASIFMIRRPDSTVALGSRVHVGGPAVKATARSATTLWIQEAGDDGACENGSDVVAYRAIAVRSSAAIPEVSEGQQIDVEGVVEEIEGRRFITGATIVLGETSEPYPPHCERDADALRARGLDDVVVLTAGLASEQDVEVCFGNASRTITIGASMAATRPPETGWAWVRGILGGTTDARRIDPRAADDVTWRGTDPSGNDVCL